MPTKSYIQTTTDRLSHICTHTHQQIQAYTRSQAAAASSKETITLHTLNMYACRCIYVWINTYFWMVIYFYRHTFCVCQNISIARRYIHTSAHIYSHRKKSGIPTHTHGCKNIYIKYMYTDVCAFLFPTFKFLIAMLKERPQSIFLQLPLRSFFGAEFL